MNSGLPPNRRSEEHTSELQSRRDLVCRLLLEKKKIALLGSNGAGKNTVEKILSTLLKADVWSSCVYFFYVPTQSLNFLFFFFFNDTATTEIYTLSLHDALPIGDDHDRPGAATVAGPETCRAGP